MVKPVTIDKLVVMVMTVEKLVVIPVSVVNFEEWRLLKLVVVRAAVVKLEVIMVEGVMLVVKIVKQAMMMTSETGDDNRDCVRNFR